MLTKSAIILLIFITDARSVIIPDELPSILSVIYSNIPTIMKGTDSRLGWGFRFGDRADFQVLVELGPQRNTQPLANQQDNRNNKRNVPNNLHNLLYAQKLKEKQKHEELSQNTEKNVISDTDGGKWLENWSQNIVINKPPPIPIKYAIDKARPGLAIGEIDAKSVIPEEEEEKIVKPFSLPSSTASSTTKKPQTTTTREEALDNVDIDDDDDDLA